MTLQAISKGFDLFKKDGLKFSLNILPVVLLFGFIASLGTSSELSKGLSNFDILILLLNNFLVAPLVTIFSILNANDLFENRNRDVLVYYAISWKFIIRILILSLISTFLIGIGLVLFIIPGIIFAGLFLLVNYFAILEEKNINESILLSWNKARGNFINYILMAAFFWFITILSISIVSYISSSFQETEKVPMIVSMLSSSLAIYIQACLISFPILIFFKKETSNQVE
tara:strand:+ start:5834 stop:6520 length:687 start_codon:yes stop_codon:yes gene_type:complete